MGEGVGSFGADADGADEPRDSKAVGSADGDPESTATLHPVAVSTKTLKRAADLRLTPVATP